MVEWDDADRAAWSVQQARDASVLVVTRSSLKSMVELDLSAMVARGYELMAPRSLLAELRGELKAAREELLHGRKSLSAGGPGMQWHEVPAGHEVLRNALERAESTLALAADSLRIEARPLGLVSRDDSSPASLRQRMGASSYDALGLVEAFSGVLWADDLGLRRFAPTGEIARSISSVSLLPALAEKGLIDARSRDRLLVSLAGRGYALVPASPGLLLEALRDAVSSPDQITRAFSVLGSSLHEPDEAARITASACRAATLEAVRTVAVERIAEQAIDAISARVPRRTAAGLVLREAERALALLPMDLASVRSTCIRVSEG